MITEWRPGECMGKDCTERAEYEIKALDPKQGLYRCPVQLCLACIRAGEGAVSIFKWFDSSRCVEGVAPSQCDQSSTGGLCDVCGTRQSI